jgi:MFS-type transporter involved in bile tolerance (Atg22 family)
VSEKNTDDTQQRKSRYAYLKYSGLAFQMAGVVVFSILAGQWLDNKLGFEKPVFTISFVLIFFSAFMYKLYRELLQK